MMQHRLNSMAVEDVAFRMYGLSIFTWFILD